MKVTLYKKTVNGKIQQWTILCFDDKYCVVEGLIGGKLTPSKWTHCKPKNVGKTNERKSDVQARFEVLSKIRLKKELGYVTSLDLVNQEDKFRPMLAEEYKQHKHKIKYPVFAQPKLNGIRANTDVDCIWSREGRPITAAPHIYEAVKGLFTYFPDLIIDGELYNHKLKYDFEEISSIVRTKNLTEEDLQKSADIMQLHVYDLYFKKQPEILFSDRKDLLASIIEGIHECVVIVPTVKVMNEAMLDKLYLKWLKEGYEGMMIRTDVRYINNRTTNLLKRKEEFDEEFKIKRIDEGEGNRAGTAGAICYEKNGEEFSTSIMGGMKVYKRIWDMRNELIGALGTVRYNEITKRGVPKFGRTVTIRDYE